MNPPITGGCLCGGVRYSISKPFVAAGYCHCTRCRRRTGTSAEVDAGIVPGSLTVEQGEELITLFDPGDREGDAFCSVCGSGLWAVAPDGSGIRSVRLGTVDGDPGIRPSHRQFVAYAASWEEIPDDGLPRFDERAS